MLRVTFLGTASSRPTVRRNVSSIAVHRNGAMFLWDCGEGTQRQMMKYGVGFAVDEIFITHLHADHYLGLSGLLRTLSLQSREDPLIIWGPPGSTAVLRTTVELGGDRTRFPVAIREIPAGESIRYDGFSMEAYETDHRASSVGLALVENPRLGRFDVNKARALGIEEGPLYSQLHGGQPISLADGRVVLPDEVVGLPRPGRKVVYTGDTRPSQETVRVAQNADLLIHEATFSEEEKARALETRHSTAREAAEIGKQAGVRSLLLTHFSARYSEQAERLREEAASVFPDVRIAADGTSVEVGFADAATETAG